jgi:hypothetical protein
VAAATAAPTAAADSRNATGPGGAPPHAAPCSRVPRTTAGSVSCSTGALRMRRDGGGCKEGLCARRVLADAEWGELIDQLLSSPDAEPSLLWIPCLQEANKPLQLQQRWKETGVRVRGDIATQTQVHWFKGTDCRCRKQHPPCQLPAQGRGLLVILAGRCRWLWAGRRDRCWLRWRLFYAS